MIDIGITDHGKTTLEKLFKEHTRYVVPFFQREYSWAKDDWRDFWDDIIRTKNSGRAHFFGFMAFQRSDECVIIIEGQQRISTVTILAAVARDILRQMRYDRWKDIETKYIKSEDEFSQEDNYTTSYKLELSEMNRSFFRNFIQEGGNPEDKLQSVKKQTENLSNRQIYDCYKYFYTLITKNTEGLADKERRGYILSILQTAVREFIIFSLDVDNELTAYNIFQTLNDRGLDLALADLLKVHLFQLAGKEHWEEAKVRWNEIREMLSQVSINSFLRHYWLSCERVVEEKDLLREFQEKIKTPKDAFDFLNQLRQEAEIYEALLNPTLQFWEDPQLVDLLEDLQLLSSKMPLPLLMAAYIQIKRGHFSKFIEATIAFIFRYVTIAENDNKVLERLLSDVSIDLRAGKIRNVEEFKKRLQREYVNDETFVQQFSTNETKTARVARYILKKIENHLTMEQEKFHATISLEHILPQNLDPQWEAYLKEHGMEKDEYVYRLGNMTLLLEKSNRKARNIFFTEKRDRIYSKHTKLALNKDLATIQSWTGEDISRRQMWLAEQAVKIWRF